MTALDGLIGGIRQIYLAGVEATFKRALDFTDMAAEVLSDRLRLTVSGIRGRPIASTAPTAGDNLTFDGTQWSPTAASGTLPSGTQYQHLEANASGAWVAVNNITLPSIFNDGRSIQTAHGANPSNLFIVGGNSTGAANGAFVQLTPGSSVSGDAGSVMLTDDGENVIVEVYRDEGGQVLAFFGQTGLIRQTVNWSAGDSTALKNLLIALRGYGLIDGNEV